MSTSQRSGKRGRPAKPVDGSASALAMLGACLRRLRQERDLTLIALGEQTGYSWQHLGAVERGQVAPSEAVVCACERALAAGGQLIVLFPAVVAEQAAQRHEREAARHTVTPIPGPDVDWTRLGALASRRSPVSTGVMDELEQITDLQRTLYHELSSSQMLVPVEAHLGLLLRLLEGRQPEAVRHRLAVAAGEAAGFAAWIWFDLGDPHKMGMLYRTAGDLLSDAGDQALWSYVTGYRALTHEASGLGDEAVEYADSALHRAPTRTSRVARSWLCAVSASAAALVDSRRDSVPELLGQARDHLDSAAEREAWMYDFDHTALAGHRGQCHLRLGQPAEAITAFSEGLAELPLGHDRRGAQLTIGLAQAHLDAGDPETALAQANSALDVFAARGSASGLRRVRRMRDRLQDAGHTAAAEEIDDRVRAYLEGAS
jgi:tetratricopeptide (TPR) repeat protein/transcriptional regulator with XRE-family HTH domain